MRIAYSYLVMTVVFPPCVRNKRIRDIDFHLLDVTRTVRLYTFIHDFSRSS